jgi:Uma2 family endonuclease
MATQSRSLTYDELKRMRETRDERLELIDGELYLTPAPTPLHQDISGNLYTLFRELCSSQVVVVSTTPLWTSNWQRIRLSNLISSSSSRIAARS